MSPSASAREGLPSRGSKSQPSEGGSVFALKTNVACAPETTRKLSGKLPSGSSGGRADAGRCSIFRIRSVCTGQSVSGTKGRGRAKRSGPRTSVRTPSMPKRHLSSGVQSAFRAVRSRYPRRRSSGGDTMSSMRSSQRERERTARAFFPASDSSTERGRSHAPQAGAHPGGSSARASWSTYGHLVFVCSRSSIPHALQARQTAIEQHGERECAYFRRRNLSELPDPRRPPYRSGAVKSIFGGANFLRRGYTMLTGYCFFASMKA